MGAEQPVQGDARQAHYLSRRRVLADLAGATTGLVFVASLGPHLFRSPSPVDLPFLASPQQPERFCLPEGISLPVSFNFPITSEQARLLEEDTPPAAAFWAEQRNTITTWQNQIETLMREQLVSARQPTDIHISYVLSTLAGYTDDSAGEKQNAQKRADNLAALAQDKLEIPATRSQVIFPDYQRLGASFIAIYPQARC